MTPTSLKAIFVACMFGLGPIHAQMSMQGGTQGTAVGFCDKVLALTNDPTVAAAHWGVSVTTMDGALLCGINQAQLFRPASNNKLLTAAAALALLGPDRRFTTTVVAEGELKGGVLHGSLRLLGGGDPGFGAHDVPYVPPALQAKPSPPEPPTIADIEELADAVVAKGVRSIRGDVVGDDSYFAWDPYPRGWMMEDLLGYDGSPVSALTIHDSLVEIDVAAGAKAGDPAVVTALPDVPYYQLDNEAVTGAAGEQPRTGRVSMDRDLGSRTITISGEIAAGDAVRKQRVAIHDPAEYAALALKLALERRGVKVAGAAVAGHEVVRAAGRGGRADSGTDTVVRTILADPAGYKLTCPLKPAAGEPKPKQTVLATHQSPRLMDDVIYTAKVSQNLHAEVFLRDLGAAYTCDRTPAAAMAIVRAYLVQAGIASADLVLYDGSGLSGHDMVTPRAMTGLLVYAAKQPWFAGFKAALPVGGVDGTLASRFGPPGSALAGRVFAKTGTLGESRDLSGYLATATGQTLVFSVLVDNHPPTTTADRVVMDKIVETIAAGN